MKTGAIAIAALALITGSAMAHGSGGGGMGMGGGMGGGMSGRFGAGATGMSHMPAVAHAPGSDSMGRDDGAHADLDHDATLHAASDLGKLNADHASATAFEHASSRSTVGALATYQSQMKAALALSDSAAQSAAITAARQQLAASTKVTLTSATATKIDADLGINGASPDLGTSP